MWKLRIASLSLLAVCATTGSVLSQTSRYPINTAEELARICSDPAGSTITTVERERLFVCGAYVRGYMGYYSAQRSHNLATGFCLPEAGVSPEVVRQLYVKQLPQRPALRDYPAAITLHSILEAAYPCKA